MNIHTIIVGYIEALQPYALPLALIIIVVAFRHEIQGALNRIRGAKIPGMDLMLSLDETSPKPQTSEVSKTSTVGSNDQIVPETVVKKPTNLFWLALDLRWTQLMLTVSGPRDAIANGLRQSYWHATELELGAFIRERLRHMMQFAQGSLQSDWTVEKRQEYWNEINDIISTLDTSLRQLQPGFRATEADPIVDTHDGQK